MFARWREKRRRWRERRVEKRRQKRRRAARLQPRLTRSYMLVTVAAVLLIDLVGGWLLWFLVFRSAPSPEKLAIATQKAATEIAPLLRKPPFKAAQLATPLRPFSENRMTAAIVNRSLNIVESAPQNALRSGTSLSSQMPLSNQTIEAMQAFLRGESTVSHRSGWNSDGSSFAVVPVLDAQRKAAYLLFVRSAAPVKPGDFGRAMFATILISGTLVVLFGAVVGTAFGFLTARRLTSRLQTISQAADAWSRGEFGVLARDDSNDEVGELAQRLNQMARELQQLVALRQSLAASEERNRLARDLHDTVKQQVFATTMQIAAARALIERDSNAAQMRLKEAETLAQGAQRELTGILEQMRPASSLHAAHYVADNACHNVEDFADVLRETLAQWSRQNDIGADFQSDLLPELPQSHQQAILRIVQEALSNVLRHSNAGNVRIQMKMQTQDAPSSTRLSNCDQILVLAIADDGDGFVLQNATGMGLTNMRERAEALLHGSFSLRTQRGQGTQLEVRCCLQANRETHE